MLVSSQQTFGTAGKKCITMALRGGKKSINTSKYTNPQKEVYSKTKELITAKKHATGFVLANVM